MGTGRGSATTWSGGDALGSVRQTLDDAGGVLAATGYDPWGTPQQPLPTPFGFTGELHPQDHVYLRARWYMPGQGTFPSRDPFAGFAEMPYSLHAYQYAYSDPVRWTDPSGENPLACLVPAVADGPLPAGEVVSVVCLVGYGVYAGAVALAGAVAIDTAATTLSDITTPQRTSPLDPGPPEQSVSAGPQLRYPSIEDYIVRSPRTGPEEVCWVLPGPMLGAHPWPFTTGAPGEQVSGPVIFTARDFVSLRGPMPHDRPNIDNEGVNQKGQWAEEQFKEYITQQASPPWEIAGEHTHRGGIDGVYKRTSGGSLEYLVVEIKYFGRRPPSFNNKQLAPENIEKLLPDAVGAEEANTILNAGYRRMRVRVYVNGAIDVRELPGIPGRSP